MHSREPSSLNLFLAIVLSSIIALALTIMSLPQWLFYFWPDWLPMIIVYWALTVPDRVGPWVGFAIGTVLEVLFVRNFGVQGFGMAALAFAVNRAHLQLQILSFGPQMLVVGVLVGMFKLIVGWLYGLTTDFKITTEYWYPLLGTVLFWPFVFILLQELRRYARIR